MHRVELLKSSGFRTAVLFLSIFLGAAVLAGAAAFFIIQQELVSRHQRAVDQEYAFFSDLYRTSGEADMIDTLQAHSKTVREKDSIYLLRGPDDQVLAGNVSLSGPLPASGETSAVKLGIEADYDYFIRSGKIDALTLMVGNSAEDLSEVEEVFFTGAFWAAILLVVISLAGGIALSYRMNQRIGEIQDALEKVATGRFDVRMPKSGNGDDLDRLGTLVDDAVIRLGTAVETNRQISGDIAHDLKTPMNRLRISVEKALRLEESGQPVTAELNEIDRESRDILSTFDALLRISQIEAGARKSRFAPMDIADVVSSIAEFYSAYCEEVGVKMMVKIEDNLPRISGDRELLTQLFANLLENALKHTGKKPQIDCSVALEGGMVVARICDNGPGIPVEEREKVMRRFYRLEKSRTTPGSGLGLAMVKAIADLHGAKLQLTDNNPGLVVAVKFAANGEVDC